jgi:hypothetical protein
MSSVLTFVIVGQQDHPVYEVDLTGPKEVGEGLQHGDDLGDRGVSMP